MILKASSALRAFLYILLTFAALAHAIGPIPIAPKPVVPKPVAPVPVAPKPVAPKPVVPKPIPKPVAPKPPRIPELPLPEGGVTIEDDASVFSLGSFEDNEQTLFENFDGPTVPFFSKMYDFFAAQETYLDNVNAYADATGLENPFKDGRPTGQRLSFTQRVQSPTEHTITATFDPSKPTDICRAWKSLVTYCGDAGEACACYSGTYYVPDQWNSLAAGCAVMTTRCTGADESSASTDDPWCEIGQTASDYTNYCTDDAASVKFAATANIKTPRAQAAPDATPAPDPTTTSDAPATIKTPNESGASTSIATNSELTSWSAHSLDSVTANRYFQIFLVIASISLFGDFIIFLD
ncbi:hypothetical protein N0V90_007902 [Kalmusia sp. IMI 367209]|nr:hypothetical protein N0V90_007902 [Kalmusia sp. IMI 367209]